MNIGINTRLLLPNKLEGIGWFTYEVVKRISINHPEHTFFLFFDRPYDKEFVFSDNCVPVILHPQARHPILFKIWFDWSIPKALKKHKIDLFFSPDGFLSLRTTIPQIPVIHDLNFEHIPEDLPSKHTKYYKKYMPLFAKKAAKIITVSEFSKRDISETYGISESKIKVAYNGASDKFKPLDDETLKHQIRSEYTNGNDYLVYVGALHKRKNISRMLKAFDLYKEQSGSALKLLIVGEKLFKSPDIDQTYQSLKHKSDVIFTGRIEQDKLVKVVASAKGMVYISYFEGFGIPVLEALKCGIPVLTSNVTSLPEVGGDVVVYCDPLDINSIISGFKMLSDLEQNKNLLIQQSNKFSWDRTADLVWQVIDENLSRQSGL